MKQSIRIIIMIPQNVIKDVSNTSKIIVHDSSFCLLGSQVANKNLVLQKLLQKNSHNFGLLQGMLLSNKKPSDGRHTDIIPIVNIVFFDPVVKIFNSENQFIFFEYRIECFRTVLKFELQSSKE